MTKRMIRTAVFNNDFLYSLVTIDVESDVWAGVVNDMAMNLLIDVMLADVKANVLSSVIAALELITMPPALEEASPFC